MAAIVNTNLAGFTAVYNTVQFGGADATYKSFPPMYRLVARQRMDGSKRAAVGLDVTLNLRCIFFETSEINMANAMQTLRTLLCQPGKPLTIKGIGNGFGANGVIQGDPGGGGTNSYDDLSNGPFPHPLEMTSLGQLAWEVSWGVDFFISECQTQTPLMGAFLELVFSTTWSNDFEGISQRVLQGYVTFPSNRGKGNNSKIPLTTADQFRNQLTIALPNNFKRLTDIWHESEDKTRLDFTVVDQQLEGDTYPKGVTQASGSVSFQASAGGDNLGMNKGICTLNMTLKTAINQAKNLAGLIFFTAALAKQTELTAPDANGLATITVIPINISITNAKFDQSRVTQCSISWALTKTLTANIAASHIYDPITNYLGAIESGISGLTDGVNNYTNWRAGMLSPMWRNTGTSGLTNAVEDAQIIDLCDNVSARTIGNVAGSIYSNNAYSIPSLSCPNIPTNGGWIHFNLDVRIHRVDNSVQHRRAATYLPEAPHDITDPLLDSSNTGITLAGPYYNQDPSDQNVTEYNGQPVTYIGLSFAALRYKNKPYLPVIKSVNGLTATQDECEDQGAVQAFEVFGCPVWKIQGYRTYKVAGIVNSIKEIRQIDASASATNPLVPLVL